MKRRIAANVMGQRVDLLADVHGDFAASVARPTGQSAGMGWAVWRRQQDECYTEIVAGLDRNVAIAVAMDLHKIQDRGPRRCRARSPGGSSDDGQLPAKGVQCGLEAGHDEDHTVFIPSNVPWAPGKSSSASLESLRDVLRRYLGAAL